MVGGGEQVHNVGNAPPPPQFEQGQYQHYGPVSLPPSVYTAHNAAAEKYIFQDLRDLRDLYWVHFTKETINKISGFY